MPRYPVLQLLALACVASLGCSQSRDLREWTPSDHGEEHPSQVDPARQPPPVEQQRPAVAGSAVAALYRMSCASCHGADGAGDGPQKPEGVELADFRDPAWQSGNTDEALAMVIRAGGESHAFGERLGEAGVTALVQHIRAFAAN
ncbi:MAG: cytochrome c [Deltaproteobacteria bacterium]|nr:cytochrome c [Deltaproteobacteria bacterium]